MKRGNKLNNQDVMYEKNEDMLRSISLDCVIFSFSEGTLKVLLNRFKTHDKWMLPGGFVYYDENVDDAAYRVLKNRTSLEKIYLSQFHLFGDKDRTSIEENEQMLSEKNISFCDTTGQRHWLLQRFVSIGYYAFVRYSDVVLASTEDEDISWFNFDDIPDLYSDHNNVIEKARQVIKGQLGYLFIGYELLPEKFTMTELRTIYETILGEKLDRRNFQKKILMSGYVKKLTEVSKKFGTKSTALFSFDRDKDVYTRKVFKSYSEPIK